ncbi:MAG: HAMP domain-containing histidine kinase, partial [Cyanobacteria bacterium REEB65]|nr:HAMP domain-containing histidine kinase [Cyanobacteria bacterium REEB65]
MPRSRPRSPAAHIAMGVILVIIVLALTVAWDVLIVSDYLHLKPYVANIGIGHWLALVFGTILFSMVIAGLILFIVVQARLVRDNQLQTNFLDAVSHELRSPLTSLRLHLDTLRLREIAPQTAKEFHDMMANDVERLDTLVEHLLEAGRALHRGRLYHPQSVELSPVLDRVVASLRRRYRELPEDAIVLAVPAVSVLADPAALEIVLHNLLENAIKYSQDGRWKIRIQAAPAPEGSVAIDVRDSGVGIPRSQLKRIFQRFYR